AEAAVPPSRLDPAALGGAWGALPGVGLAWGGLGAADGRVGGRRRRRRGGAERRARRAPRPRSSGRWDRTGRPWSRWSGGLGHRRATGAATAEGGVRSEPSARAGPRLGERRGLGERLAEPGPGLLERLDLLAEREPHQ